MKLTLVLCIAACLQVNARGYAQKITISQKNVSLAKIINEIRDQSGYLFLYNDKQLNNAKKVSINVKGASIEEVLRQSFKDQSLTYTVVEKTIVIIPKEMEEVRVLTPAIPPPPIEFHGRVVNQQGEPLQNVSLLLVGTQIGTTTGSDGRFTLTAPNDKNVVVEVSIVGYQTKRVSVGKQTDINVVLEVSASGLSDVIVVGYGTQKKSDLTGAITRVDAETFKSQSMTQFTDMLTGTVAGINVNQGTSAAGGSSFLEIRGRKSLSASNAPMIVVDGAIFYGSFEDINPFDIEAIDILKDASSAAIYGSRASNGVILITTKKGKSGSPTINFSTKIGLSELNNRQDYKPLDAKGYLKFRADLLKGQSITLPNYYYSNPNELPDGVTLAQWRNASNNPQLDNTKEWLGRLRLFPTEVENYLAGKTVNWLDQVMQLAPSQTYDLSISGASDKFSYYWSGGYDDNKGIIRGDKFSAVRTKLNLDFKIKPWLKIGVNSQFAFRNEDGVPADVRGIFTPSPYGSVFDSLGNAKWYPGDYTINNPLINYYGQKKSNGTTSLFATIYTEIALPLGINYKLSFEPNSISGHDYNFWPSTKTIIGGANHLNGYGTRAETSQFGWILDNILQWKKKLGVHTFDLTFLFSSEYNKTRYTFLSNENFSPNQNLGYGAMQLGNNPSLSNADTKTTGDAVMGRLNYSLFNKYLLTLSLRRDGYSAFGQENPRSNFPAAALAWKISDENFFKTSWLDNMKLRLSWGVNGNRDIGPYAALATVSPNYYYDGTNTLIGVYNYSLASPCLSWERTEAYNVGIDLNLLKNRISLNANYYLMKTTNLLMNRLLPAITGFNNVTANLGEVDNHGFEFTLNTVNFSKAKYSWKTNFVFSFNRNKIKHLFGDYKEVIVNGKTVKQEIPDYTNEWFPGEAIDRVWNYNVTGIWQVPEASAAKVYHLVPGDIKAQDVNGDGSYQALDDKLFTGYTQPRYRLGLRNDFSFLKNRLSISFFVRADLGQIGEFNEALHNGFSTYDRNSTLAIPYWTPDNPINDYPRLTVNATPYGGGISIYKPRSFVRIQDFTMSYNFNQNIIQRLKLTILRIFSSIRNIYSFDKWPGWDPESDLPMPRTYTIGANLSL
jgi:TonB-linked SusC/RagA family outer membrane protein